jgi:syntaxin 5
MLKSDDFWWGGLAALGLLPSCPCTIFSMPPSSMTSLRDRTVEFTSFVERLQRQNPTLPLSTSAADALSSKDTTPGSIQKDFAKKAADIGHGIHRTSLKLQKLAALAKRTSMFDDSSTEVDELTGMIKQDIQ